MCIDIRKRFFVFVDIMRKHNEMIMDKLASRRGQIYVSEKTDSEEKNTE